MTDPMTMSRLKAYRRNVSAIEDIKAELSGKYVADSISVCGWSVSRGLWRSLSRG